MYWFEISYPHKDNATSQYIYIKEE